VAATAKAISLELLFFVGFQYLQDESVKFPADPDVVSRLFC
jgi:hypothetical protein